jgi:hypothetical protein
MAPWPSTIHGRPWLPLHRLLDGDVEVLSPYSARFGLPPNNGLRLLDEFLLRACNPDRDRILAEATGR